MDDDERGERRQRIEAAALSLLAELGYRRTSMLMIAKRARASNQTLYAWYGSKADLFRAIIDDNGRAVRRLLDASLAATSSAREGLSALGPALLRFTTDEKAIIMNRAAVVDAADTGTLAAAIDEVARDAILPLIAALMQRLVDERRFDAATDPYEAARTYVALLFGESPLRQAMGNEPPFDEARIAREALRAETLTCRLYGAERDPTLDRRRRASDRRAPKGDETR